MCCQPAIGCRTYFTISRHLGTRDIRKRPHYTFQIVFVYSSIVSKCEDVEDVERDCVQCGVRKHSFWDDPVGSMLSYLCEPCPWVNKVIAIAHKAKAFDLQIIKNRPILLRWRPERTMDGLKIMCVMMEHLVFLDSVYLLPSSLRKLPEAFGLTVSKSW